MLAPEEVGRKCQRLLYHLLVTSYYPFGLCAGKGKEGMVHVWVHHVSGQPASVNCCRQISKKWLFCFSVFYCLTVVLLTKWKLSEDIRKLDIITHWLEIPMSDCCTIEQDVLTVSVFSFRVILSCIHQSYQLKAALQAFVENKLLVNICAFFR
jgi:hypothetical protein